MFVGIRVCICAIHVLLVVSLEQCMYSQGVGGRGG